MSTILTHLGTVYPWQCDHMGHMNVMWYTGKFDEATWQLAGALGLSPDAMREGNSGMVAAEQLTHYRAEVLAGDLISIHSRVVGAGARSLRFVHELRKEPSGEVAATSALVGVHIDRATRKAMPFPTHVQQRIRELLSP